MGSLQGDRLIVAKSSCICASGAPSQICSGPRQMGLQPVPVAGAAVILGFYDGACPQRQAVGCRSYRKALWESYWQSWTHSPGSRCSSVCACKTTASCSITKIKESFTTKTNLSTASTVSGTGAGDEPTRLARSPADRYEMVSSLWNCLALPPADRCDSVSVGSRAANACLIDVSASDGCEVHLLQPSPGCVWTREAVRARRCLCSRVSV